MLPVMYIVLIITSECLSPVIGIFGFNWLSPSRVRQTTTATTARRIYERHHYWGTKHDNNPYLCQEISRPWSTDTVYGHIACENMLASLFIQRTIGFKRDTKMFATCKSYLMYDNVKKYCVLCPGIPPLLLQNSDVAGYNFVFLQQKNEKYTPVAVLNMGKITQQEIKKLKTP